MVLVDSDHDPTFWVNSLFDLVSDGRLERDWMGAHAPKLDLMVEIHPNGYSVIQL